MRESTNAAVIPSDIHRWEVAGRLFSETKEFQVERQRDWYDRQSTSTDIVQRKNATLVYQLPEVKNQQAKVSLSNKVPGSVLSVENMIVECEVDFGGKKLKIQLQQSLFPNSIRYGTAFFLELVEEDGVRKPKISARKPDLAKLDEIKKRAQEIIQTL